MFERYTDRARRVVVMAQEEARELGHNYVGTEHILLGLIHEGSGIAAQALTALGVSLDETRAQVEAIIGRGDLARVQDGPIPFTPRTKKVLELAAREARDLGHDYIGTEHILLGLMRESDGVGAQVLNSAGIEFSAVRHQIRELLRGQQESYVPPGEPLKNLALHFMDCVAHGKRPLTDGRNGAEVIRVMAAIDKSLAEHGAPVDVS